MHQACCRARSGWRVPAHLTVVMALNAWSATPTMSDSALEAVPSTSLVCFL